MKRALFEHIQVTPYTSGAAIDRAGYLSAVLGAAVTASGTLTIAVTHCDTVGGAYETVADECQGVGSPLTNIPVTADINTMIPLELLGCKRYVKIAITAGGGAAATYALALGDAAALPVT